LTDSGVLYVPVGIYVDLSKAQGNKKEPLRPKEQYPWFWQDGEFTGDRVNDIDLSINDKQKARKDKNKHEGV